MSAHYKYPMLLIEFDQDKSFSLQSVNQAKSGARGGGSGSASDFAQADQMLANFFGNGNTFKGKDIAYYYGSAVAFGCNYGHGQTDTASKWDSNVNAINQDCGVAGSGWYSYPSSKASYGRTLSSESFC